jgi:hypothetical protein
MRSTERPEFTALLGALCAGFNQPVTPERIEGYWRGLSNMQLPAFERVVDYALGETGPDKLPTAPQLWRLYRELTAAARKEATPAPVQGALVDPHPFTLHANRVMFRLLRELAQKHGTGATPESLAAMVAAKARVVGNYRYICEDEPAACAELRDVLTAELIALYVPASPDWVPDLRVHA